MAEYGCPAYIPEGHTSFTKTRHGTGRVAVLDDDKFRDKSVSEEQFAANYEKIHTNREPGLYYTGAKVTEERKRGRIIYHYKKIA